MSEFFKALEQAERDRALGRQARHAAGDIEPAAPSPPMPDVATVPPAAEEVVAPTAFRRPAPVPDARRQGGTPEDESAAAAGIDGHLVSLVTPTTFEAEQYRTLRHMIEELHKRADISIVACTSPSGGDGKTTTAVNLAGALAQARDAKVLLVDADLRRPAIARELTLGDSEGPGLVGAILHRELALADAVRHRPPFTFSILPAGSTVANPYELLKSPRLGELMEEARRQYEYVVLDTPPVVSIPDCRAIASSVDGFLLIVAAHRTPRRLVEEALNAMEPAKVIGLVFNRDDHPLGGSYAERYGYAASSNGHRGRRWRQAVERARDFLPGGRRRGPRIR